MTRVSVLLAVHNGEPFIDEAIRSVIEQTHADWELVIVSNGSTDRTLRICEAKSAADPRIRVYSIPDRNKNRAYNHAYENSTGDLLCFFAADDVLPPDSLAERVRALHGESAEAFATCCLRTISDDPRYDGVTFPRRMDQPNYSGGSLFFPRELARRIFPLPETQPNEDTWASLHLRAFGVNRHIPRALYLYRIHGGNSFGYGAGFQKRREQYLRRMHAYELFYERYGDYGLDFVERAVAPFVHGLAAARERKVLRLLLLRGLDVKSRMVLAFYCSEFLYRIRHTFFRTFSGALARGQ